MLLVHYVHKLHFLPPAGIYTEPPVAVKNELPFALRKEIACAGVSDVFITLEVLQSDINCGQLSCIVCNILSSAKLLGL